MQQQYWLFVLEHVGVPTLGLFWRSFCRRSTSFYGSCREGAHPSMTAPCACGIVWGHPADVLLAQGFSILKRCIGAHQTLCSLKLTA